MEEVELKREVSPTLNSAPSPCWKNKRVLAAVFSMVIIVVVVGTLVGLLYPRTPLIRVLKVEVFESLDPVKVIQTGFINVTLHLDVLVVNYNYVGSHYDPVLTNISINDVLAFTTVLPAGVAPARSESKMKLIMPIQNIPIPQSVTELYHWAQDVKVHGIAQTKAHVRLAGKNVEFDVYSSCVTHGYVSLASMSFIINSPPCVSRISS